MKKAKLMLAAIAVLAIVGGTMAAKAKRNSFLYCSTTTGVTGVTKLSYAFTPVLPGLTSYCTAISSSLVKTTLITEDI